MAIKVTKTGENYYEAKGRSAGTNVGIFFIIIFILGAALLAIGGSFIGGAIMLTFVTVISVAISIHHKSVCQKKINEYAEKHIETHDQRDQKIAQLQKEIDELKKTQ